MKTMKMKNPTNIVEFAEFCTLDAKYTITQMSKSKDNNLLIVKTFFGLMPFAKYFASRIQDGKIFISPNMCEENCIGYITVEMFDVYEQAMLNVYDDWIETLTEEEYVDIRILENMVMEEQYAILPKFEK